jgi:hypothetical protein
MSKKTFAALGAVAVVVSFSISAQAQPNPNPIGVDPEHYQCYPISAQFGPRETSLKDQFTGAIALVGQAVLICAPVSKNQGLVADTRSHLVCYRVQNPEKAAKQVEIRNQFGRLRFPVDTNATLLCVPSLKRVLPTP